MYIRRKVFSVAFDENGEERYFSTNEIINEEDYLDEVLYSEKKKKEKKSHLGRNIALGTAGTAALAGGGIYGAKKIGANQEALCALGMRRPHRWLFPHLRMVASRFQHRGHHHGLCGFAVVVGSFLLR